jgi:hypothetical protein
MEGAPPSIQAVPILSVACGQLLATLHFIYNIYGYWRVFTSCAAAICMETACRIRIRKMGRLECVPAGWSGGGDVRGPMHFLSVFCNLGILLLIFDT